MDRLHWWLFFLLFLFVGASIFFQMKLTGEKEKNIDLQSMITDAQVESVLNHTNQNINYLKGVRDVLDYKTEEFCRIAKEYINQSQYEELCNDTSLCAYYVKQFVFSYPSLSDYCKTIQAGCNRYNGTYYEADANGEKIRQCRLIK